MSLYRISKSRSWSKPRTNKCIILDLDETLVHTSSDYDALLNLRPFSDPEMIELRRSMYLISLDGYQNSPSLWGCIRPHTEEFLDFCFSYFDKVCVWSAGTETYVDEIVEILFNNGRQPDCVYARSKCHDSRDGNIIKPISKMIDDQRVNGRMSYENTFFIDDRGYAFTENPDNGIVIPPYHPLPTIDGLIEDDQRLPQLIDWFNRPEVANSKDVRHLNKTKIFK